MILATTPGWVLRYHGQRRIQRLKPIGTSRVAWRTVVPLALIAGIIASVVGGSVLGPLVTAYICYTRWWIADQRRRVGVDAILDIYADAISGIADDVRAGASPIAALGSAAKTLSVKTGDQMWQRLSLRPDHGTAALRNANGPLREPCQQLAAVWALLDAGAPVTGVLSVLDSELTTWRQRRDTLRSETAAATATALLLGVLPFAGIAMGYLLGADPVSFLLHHPLGAACAVAGAVLQMLGMTWALRIVVGDDMHRAAAAHSREPVDPVESGARQHRLALVAGAGAAAVIVLLISGIASWILAPVVATLAYRTTHNAEPAALRLQRQLFVAQLPLALLLLSAVLRAGAPTSYGIAVVSEAVTGPVGSWWQSVAKRLAAGESPESAWCSPPFRDRDAEAIGAAMVRSSESGAALAAACERLAERVRRRNEAELLRAARRANVLIVLPLATCLLPAFVAWGVVPIVTDLLVVQL